MIGIPVGWILYLGFPVLAAVLVSQKDGARYLGEDGPRVTAWLAWVVAAIAYMSLLTDRLPGSAASTVPSRTRPFDWRPDRRPEPS